MVDGLIIRKDPVVDGVVFPNLTTQPVQPHRPRLHQHRQDFNKWQKRSDKLIKNDHNETGLLWGHTCPLCECVCGFVVGIHQGLGGQSSASSQTDDPADWLTFWGLTAGGGGGILDRPGRGERMGKRGKMEEVKFRTEGRKVRAKGNLKRKSTGGETEVVTTADLEYILVVFVHLLCCGLPWFWCLPLVWSSELTPDPGFWPYPLPPVTPSRLANMCYLARTHTHTHIYGNTESQSHMYTHSYVCIESKKKNNAAHVRCPHNLCTSHRLSTI